MAPFSSPTPRRRVLLLLSYHLTATERGIMKYAREADWTLDLRALRTGFLPEPGGIDGILCLLGGWESRPEMTEFVRRAGVPVVDMHGDEIGKVPAGRVLADNLRIGELAAGHFATRGFTNCLFCCRSLSDWSARQRQRSFGATLDQLGIRNRIFEHRAMTRHGIPVGIPVGDVVAGLVHELASVETPIGIFAENDDIAALVLDARGQLGIRVPEQAAVLGVSNDPLVVDFAPVPLSSVDPDVGGRAYRAAQLLARMMDGEPAPPQPILIEPPGIVTRQSTDILAVPDLRVATALTRIRRQYSNASLNPATVSAACGVPPRTLACSSNTSGARWPTRSAGCGGSGPSSCSPRPTMRPRRSPPRSASPACCTCGATFNGTPASRRASGGSSAGESKEREASGVGSQESLSWVLKLRGRDFIRAG